MAAPMGCWLRDGYLCGQPWACIQTGKCQQSQQRKGAEMKFHSKHRPCCNILEGLDVVQACDNCGTVVVEKDAGKHTVQVIDSAKAKKALECIAAIKGNWIDEGIEGGYIYWDDLVKYLRRYGFM